MVTGNPGQTPQRVGMSLGADDYLTKPFEIDELLQRVAARLDRAEIHWRVEGRTLRELRTNLHSILPHEFFTPLVGIIGLAEVLKEDADHLSPAQIVEYAADIERSGQRLHRTLRNYLKILALDQGATEAQPAGPGDRPTGAEALSLVSRTARSVAARHNRTADLVLRIQPGTQPRIDRESLNVLTEELVENACSYSRHGSPIQVELAAEKGGTVLRVSDKGRGMTAEQVKRIGAFRQFDRKRYEQQGLGLGLSLAGRLIQRAGATLEVQSATGEGTTVTVGLPDGR
jgi:signal transduction histidine kinase